MRVIFLSKPLTIILCFILWGVIQVTAALISLNLPDRVYSPDGWLFRPRPFERDGVLYEKLFRIKRWKHLLPDGASAWKQRGYLKKSLVNTTPENLRRFLVESARGELTHWLAILPFWIFGFITPGYVVGMMLVYAVLINLPCIIAQRYNRPRIQRLLQRMEKTEALKKQGSNDAGRSG